MHRIIIIVGLVLLSLGSFAQISAPEKRKFNTGVYLGLSIWRYKPMVALDLSYAGTTLRIMPNYNYYSVGLTQELAKISPVFYNLIWTASIYGGYGIEEVSFAADPTRDYKKTIYTSVLNTGIKTYFSKRMYTNIMGGVMYTKSIPSSAEDENILNPYFEFGLGMNFFKNYPKLKAEEIEE